MEHVFCAHLSRDCNTPELAQNEIKEKLAVSIEKEVISDQNWNAQWENDYEPVQVDNFCIIKAGFHDIDTQKFDHVISITPKMSFGTGHHETTFLMMNEMFSLNFKGKSSIKSIEFDALAAS